MILGHFFKSKIVDVAVAVSRQKTAESWKELKKLSTVILSFDLRKLREQILGFYTSMRGIRLSYSTI